MKPSTNGKTAYRTPPNNFEVKGLDLNIDLNTQKLCETYNQSSGATRSVLYLLLVISIISLIAVCNNNWKYNWTRERINAYKARVDKQDSLLGTAKIKNSKTKPLDSLKNGNLKDFF